MTEMSSRTVNEQPPHRDGRLWQAEGEYEFNSDLQSTLAAVRSCVPPHYQTVEDASDELRYARPFGGNTFYLTIHLIPDGRRRTKAKLSLKSLPS